MLVNKFLATILGIASMLFMVYVVRELFVRNLEKSKRFLQAAQIGIAFWVSIFASVSSYDLLTMSSSIDMTYLPIFLARSCLLLPVGILAGISKLMSWVWVDVLGNIKDKHSDE